MKSEWGFCPWQKQSEEIKTATLQSFRHIPWGLISILSNISSLSKVRTGELQFGGSLFPFLFRLFQNQSLDTVKQGCYQSKEHKDRHTNLDIKDKIPKLIYRRENLAELILVKLHRLTQTIIGTVYSTWVEQTFTPASEFMKDLRSVWAWFCLIFKQIKRKNKKTLHHFQNRP